MGQSLGLPLAIGFGLISYFYMRRAMHEPGHVDPSTEGSIQVVRGEHGRRAYHQERKRDREAYPLPLYLEKWHKVSEINLAVTGESGTGKSSLINALLGANVAKTGVSETTGVPKKPYKLPIRDEGQERVAINLWDLPGQGTMNFPADKYIKDLGVRDKYTREFNRDGSVDISIFLLSSRRIQKEKEAHAGIGSDPINRDWIAFQHALVRAVAKARGVPDRNQAGLDLLEEHLLDLSFS
ncbi:hypothetical protein BSKO_08857 [Bryopsis sp. KO-2023]|nr:hypothetical protein BSKO_08857 [Bryopsis sp. KO-2023]